MSEATTKSVDSDNNVDIVELTDSCAENGTAIEAISERLSEITELAEQLDQTLKSAQQDCSIAPAAASLPIAITGARKFIDGAAGAIDEDAASTSKFLRVEELKSDDEFLTASECTLQHSRSSSYNTASECEHLYSPWWEYGKDDVRENISKEKLVLAVGIPELPLAKSVLKPAPEVPPGKIAREVTETTHLKVQHSHTLGVKSFVLTSETVRDTKSSEVRGSVAGKDDVVRGKVDSASGSKGQDDGQLLSRMKECGDWIQLKILEVSPELTTLGDTLEEAIELQQAHDEVLRQLQNKQSPVEELLRQADQLISTQKPRAEVYAAMAESLGKAWNDVNAHLELRKLILDLNVQYHTRAQEFFESMDQLEVACSDTLIPIDIDAVKSFLTGVHDLRRSVLESLMAALQAGNTIIAKLKELGAVGTLDSRPDRIRSSVNRAIAQVQGWMDKLYLRRQTLDAIFTKRKVQLEQCLALAILAADLRELEELIIHRRELLINSDQLGDSASSAELLQHEHKKLLPEAKILQEKALKITKATEQLVQSGCFAGEQAIEQSYTVLSSASDYLSDLQQRDALFERVITFFKFAESALAKLDQIEVKLRSTELPPTSLKLVDLHAACAQSIDEITAHPLSEGYSILQLAGGNSSAGVRLVVEELENRKISLESLCIAHKEKNRKVLEALNSFLERHDELYGWLVEIAEAFLQRHKDMGRDLTEAKDFLELHNQLLLDLQTKGNEINNSLLTLPPILEYLEDHQRQEVDKKVEGLHIRWLKLKNILESRLDLALLFVKFHTEADRVDKEMNAAEEAINKEGTAISDDNAKILEERMESLIPLYQSAKNTGITFINQSQKVTEPHLDTEHARVCVESVLEHLAGRQLTINRSWQTFHTEIVENREVLIRIEQNMVESTRTINWVTKLDTQLYPVITIDATNPKDVANHIEQKLQTVLPEIRRAQLEVEQRMRTAESLLLKTQEPNTVTIRNQLQEINQKLIRKTTDYQILLQMMLSYFNNLTEIDKAIQKFNAYHDRVRGSKHPIEVETLAREIDGAKNSVLNLFAFGQNECEEIVNRIINQEPEHAARQDIEKLQYAILIRRDTFEKDWGDKRDQIEAHRQLCQFDIDLQQINETLDELTRQLTDLKGQYGESLAGARNTSTAFVHFEKTIGLLENRINNFIQTGKELLSNQHVNSPHVAEQIENLQNRWIKFKNQIDDTRKNIDLSVQYFELINEADEWFKEGNRLLISIARRSATVKQPEEAQSLLNEIELFLKPGESKQNDRIAKIAQLGTQLFGIDRSQHVIVESREMLSSFNAIRDELSALANNLKAAEEQRMAAEEQRMAAEEQRMAAEKMKLETAVLQTSATQVTVSTVHDKGPERGYQITEVVDELPKFEPPKFVSPLSDQIIQEGSIFTFVCQISGVPLPVVTWHKDGISIQNNPDYLTTFDHGLCTLTIEETFAEDSARYTCKAINAAGSAESSALLTVKENEPEEQLIPPRFSKLLQPGIAKEGAAFQFECIVEGYPLPTVQWFKNADCIDNSPDYTITYNNGDAILRFERIFLGDKAEYTCKATNQVGVAQSSTNLNVLPLEPSEAPSFITPLCNVMARAGQKIKLECEVSGLPPPNLLWSHNGKTVKETREIKLHREGQKATLIVHEAFPKDAGSYGVTATNLAGEISSTCGVSVKGRLPAETSDSELASDMEPIKPSIQLALKDVSINEGNGVRLDCVIVGQPEPEVIWYHNDRPVKESTDFQLLFQGDRCSLVIQEALLEDSGEYKVVALNSAGEASSKALLTVTAVKSAEKETKPEEEKLETTGSAPKFSKLLTDILVSEGEKVILEAAVSGEPRPQVTWLLNNAPIEASEHVKIAYDSDGNIKLDIGSVKPEDRGVYTVKASNPSGDAKCFSQLIVKSFRVGESRVQHEEVKSAPVFKLAFEDRSVFENTSTKFECIVTGKPRPKVKWFYNDQPVTGKNFLISTSGDRQILAIPLIGKDNGGTITCVAENEAGKATCSANLSVQLVSDITLPEMERSLSDLVIAEQPPGWSKEIEQHTESSFTYKREINVQSSTATSSKIISTIGSAEQPHVEEHKYTSQDDKSFKQINLAAPEIREVHKEEEYHKIGQEPPVVHEKSSSFYAVGGTKEAEVIPQIQELPRKVKTRPPKFTTPVIGKIVDQDANIVLEGILDALPTPEVAWTKNGLPFTPGDNCKVTFQHNCAKLELKNVSIRDSGMYSCTAVNEAGKAISTADLVVRKTIFPPVFGRRLQAQVIKKDDRVVMEVEVTGTPDPIITWHKDGLPLEAALKDGFKIKSEGNCHTLIIDKADLKLTGKYMVRAVNDGGEAQSIADIAVFEPTPDTMVEVVKTVVYEDVRKHETLTSAADQTSETITTPNPLEIKKPIAIPDTYKSFEPQFLESSHTEFSTHTESSIKQDTKTLTLERTTPVPDIEMPKRVTTPIVPQDTIDEGIQTTSITKQQSLDYFVKKMKEAEEPVKIKEIVKPTPIKQEMYTRFEETQTPPVVQPYMSESFCTYSSSQLVEEFNLTPEPPPEICYVPKQEIIRSSKEEVTEKAKRLQESYRDLSESEIPLGGVRIFPAEQTEPKPIPAPYYKAETIGPVLRPLSPRPEALEMEKLWTPKLPDLERNIYVEKEQVVEPSTTAISMEKTWAHKHTESNVQKSWPPQQSELQAKTWSTHSTLEKKWTPVTTETVIKETKTITPIIQETIRSQTFVQEELPPPLEVPHYIAQVSHTSNIREVSAYEESKSQYISEERSTKASEIIKSWPPKLEDIYPLESLSIRPVSVQDITDEIFLEPGTPPEIVYAQPPTVQRRISYVETIEQNLEKNLDKVPSKVLPGAVRTMPPPLPPKQEKPQAPPVPAKSIRPIEVPFERFPELEPFPFMPEPVRCRSAKLAPPPTPSKFIKGRFTDSDYESDIDAVRISSKWRPYASDNDEPTFRHVDPPRFRATPRSRSTEKEPVPPSRFEQPPQTVGPPRPTINFEACKQIRREAQAARRQAHFVKSHEVKKPAPPPPLRPGTPPELVHAEPPRPKPQSPKAKHRVVIDGYMADTDEPFAMQQTKTISSSSTSRSEYRHEESSSYQHHEETTTQQKVPVQIQKSVPPPKVIHHKKHVASSASSKKKLVSTPIVTNVTTEKREVLLEPFPFKPDPPTSASKMKVPPPPSPSKFIKGEFKESDYESDYDRRIQSVWKSDQDRYYKPVRPVLTPTGRPQYDRERSPTPPTAFDKPHEVAMPTRPKFEPIEKPAKTVKLDQIIKPVPKPTPIFRPKPIVQQAPIADVIIATPAVPQKFTVLQPGTPPEIAYAPRRTQYYKSTTSAPYNNAVQTETSNVMHFNESTERSHRTVSLQQTTKVIKFGDQTKTTSKEQVLEPLPFKPEPDRPRRRSAPPPPKPKKFVQGEFRESDYESEVENVRFKPKWIPGSSDNEEPHFRKVHAPMAIRSSSVPSSKDRVLTPMEFDTQPPYQSSHYDSALTKSTASKIATQYMDNMTSTFKSKAQQFVSNIMDDVNTQSSQKKPILKAKNETDDAQVYREETRAAQYGTKHVDPDTGLIYFKYDFGYEFGIILPGEGKNGEIPVPKKTILQPPKRSHSIELPVHHERSSHRQLAPQFQPKKFVPGKNVKWEPTSESEMSEYEADGRKKQARWEQSSCSPVSLSPSLPSTSPAFNNYLGSAPVYRGADTPPSCPATPAMQQSGQIRRAPMFITPLRDIAVVSGQMARFECIVQSEPAPSMLWSKNGRILQDSQDYQQSFRNGVCRLTIPKAYPEDAGTYTCTANNHVGVVGTTATLQVPGERRSSYI